MIEVQDVSKRFIIHHQRVTELKERVVRRLKGNRYDTEEFWALKGVSCRIREGESVALIGANGSGKSTLLQIIGKIFVPDGGSVRVKGRIAALLELGAGFNPELTGRENVYLASAIQGFSRREIEARMEEIIEFSELERFIDTPIKNYSTGMYMRLGFSVATHVDPDILLIDEILAVGDEAFQAKCIRRIEEFRRRGKTIVFVSHSMESVRRICSRAILLDNGQLALDAEPDEVIRHYYAILGIPSAPVESAAEPAAPPDAPAPMPAAPAAELAPAPEPPPASLPLREELYLEVVRMVGRDGAPIPAPEAVQGVVVRVVPAPAAAGPVPRPAAEPEARPAPAPPAPRHGIGLLRIERVSIDAGATGPILPGGPLRVRVHYHAECIVKRPVLGLAVHALDGSHIVGPNTKGHGIPIPHLEGSGYIDWDVPRLPLNPGTYFLTVGLFNHAVDVVYDFCDRRFPFVVAGDPAADHGSLALESSFSAPVAAPLAEEGEEPGADGGPSGNLVHAGDAREPVSA